MEPRAPSWIQKMIFSGCCLGFAWPASGAAVIEHFGRLEINWSTLRMRFYGQSQARGPDEASFKAAEKRAWNDGLLYVRDAVRNYNIMIHEHSHANLKRLSEDARLAAQKVTRSTFSINTTYFSDGTIRVEMENLLAKALQTSVLHFRQKEAPVSAMIEYTGVVFELDRKIKPRPTYEIIDQEGVPLFHVTDMAEAAYRRHLMGRWFERPSPAELLDAVGKHPLRIPVVADQEGRFTVVRASWEELVAGYRTLLVSGQIALSMP